MENQVCISLHLKLDQWHKRFATKVVSSNSCDILLTVLAYIQEQQNCCHKTWHIGIEIISNGSSKISFVSLLRKKLSFPLYVLVLWFSG